MSGLFSVLLVLLLVGSANQRKHERGFYRDFRGEDKGCPVAVLVQEHDSWGLLRALKQH